MSIVADTRAREKNRKNAVSAPPRKHTPSALWRKSSHIIPSRRRTKAQHAAMAAVNVAMVHHEAGEPLIIRVAHGMSRILYNSRYFHGRAFMSYKEMSWFSLCSRIVDMLTVMGSGMHCSPILSCTRSFPG